MNKNIADYLPYYIGQDVSTVLGTFQLIGIEKDGVYITNKWYGRKIFSSVTIKPILRPLSDMTPVEHEEFASLDILRKYNKPWDGILKNADTTHYLLKQGFDLFGLIEAGLAVDKTKEARNVN